MGTYLKDNQVKQLLKELVMKRRHYHTSIFFLCQMLKSVERDIQKLFSNISDRLRKKTLSAYFPIN